jgi:CheY-like chemotaxis protein
MAPTDQKTKVVSPAEVPEDLPLPSDPKVIFLGGLFALAQYRLPPAALAAPSAEAAREVLRSARPIDLLLTDIIMPSSHGRDLAKEAERLRPGIRILYMTGYSRNAVVHQGRLDEGVDLLQKPVSQAQLAMRVRAALDRKS